VASKSIYSTTQQNQTQQIGGEESSGEGEKVFKVGICILNPAREPAREMVGGPPTPSGGIQVLSGTTPQKKKPAAKIKI